MTSPRYAAIDIFRGLTIFLMIVVNTLGAGAAPYPVLVHAEWIGFTGADFVFPSFLFAMGSAMVFSFRREMSETAFLTKIVKRSVLLFAVGFLMYWFPFVHYDESGGLAVNAFVDTRVMGVLQRIALCYLLAALLVRHLKPWQLFAGGVAILLFYWGLLVFGAPPGEAFDKTANLGSQLDRFLIPASHLYHWDGGFEPEGVLGTLPATVNVVAGYLVCRWLTSSPATMKRLSALCAAGIALVLLALLWAQWFPLSKKLWTGSFVLLTVGLDMVLLSLLVGAYDLFKLPRSGFFEILGLNPLAVYLFSELVIPAQALAKPFLGSEPYTWLGIHIFQAVAPGALGTLLCAIAFTLFCWLFGYLLYRNKVFVRL